jgi:hypothetical protein
MNIPSDELKNMNKKELVALYVLSKNHPRLINTTPLMITSALTTLVSVDKAVKMIEIEMKRSLK